MLVGLVGELAMTSQTTLRHFYFMYFCFTLFSQLSTNRYKIVQIVHLFS